MDNIKQIDIPSELGIRFGEDVEKINDDKEALNTLECWGC